MRLINVHSMALEEYFGEGVPQYAILSHTWLAEEVTMEQLQTLHSPGTSSPTYNLARQAGFQKIQYACAQARLDGFDFVWVDTCCIDKSNSAELSEAINSMWRWYQGARVCYVYLQDVTLKPQCPNDPAMSDLLDAISVQALIKTSNDPSSPSHSDREAFNLSSFSEQLQHLLKHCRWATRSWTLQELLAPTQVKFFATNWLFLGTKVSMSTIIADATGIDQQYLLEP